MPTRWCPPHTPMLRRRRSRGKQEPNAKTLRRPAARGSAVLWGSGRRLHLFSIGPMNSDTDHHVHSRGSTTQTAVGAKESQRAILQTLTPGYEAARRMARDVQTVCKGLSVVQALAPASRQLLMPYCALIARACWAWRRYMSA